MKFRSQLLLPLVLLLAMTITSAYGQVQGFRIDPTEQIKQSIKSSVTRHKAECKATLDACLEEIFRVCDIDPKQKTKLSIAVKGAISKSTEEFKKQQIEMFKQRLGENLDLSDLEEEGDKKKDAQPLNANQNVIAAAAMVANVGFAPNDSEIQRHPIWKKAVASVLKGGQKEKLRITQEQRAQYRKQAAIQLQVAKADQLLLLDADQRQRLTQTLETHLGKVFEKSSLSTAPRFIPMGAQSNAIDRKVIEQFLSKKQMEIWMERIDPQLAFLKDSVENPRKRGVRRGVPAGLINRIQLAAPAVRPAIKRNKK